MIIEVDLELLLKIIIMLLGAILLVYLIMVAKNLVDVLKKADAVLDDVKIISEISSRKAEDVEPLIGDITGIANNVFGAIKGNQSITAAASSVFHGIMSLFGMIKNKKGVNK